jgi:hypothetical protein
MDIILLCLVYISIIYIELCKEEDQEILII